VNVGLEWVTRCSYGSYAIQLEGAQTHMLSWLINLLHRAGSNRGLTIGDDFITLPSPRDLPTIFRAIDAAIPKGAVLYLERGLCPPDLRAFLDERSIAPRATITPGTIWPRPHPVHMFIEADTVARLASFAEQLAAPEVCWHLVVYQDEQVLLAAYDVPDDPIWVNGTLPETVQRTLSKVLAGHP
jgi:hypothetical protein